MFSKRQLLISAFLMASIALSSTALAGNAADVEQVEFDLRSLVDGEPLPGALTWTWADEPMSGVSWQNGNAQAQVNGRIQNQSPFILSCGSYGGAVATAYLPPPSFARAWFTDTFWIRLQNNGISPIELRMDVRAYSGGVAISSGREFSYSSGWTDLSDSLGQIATTTNQSILSVNGSVVFYLYDHSIAGSGVVSHTVDQWFDNWRETYVDLRVDARLSVPAGGSNTITLRTAGPTNSEARDEGAVVPDSMSINLGRQTSGDLASLLADDDNPLVICKFFVPNLASPFVQYSVGGQTQLPTQTSMKFRLQSKMTSPGAFSQTIRLFNFQTNTYEESRTDSIGLAYQTTELAANGDVTRYVGDNGALQSQIQIKQVGPSAVLLPCASFESANWVVAP